MNRQGDRGAIRLLANDTLDVDDPLLTEDLSHAALAALIRTSDDEDLVILVDGDRSDL